MPLTGIGWLCVPGLVIDHQLMTPQEAARDLLDPDLYAGDPWPVYRYLRDEAPVHRDDNGLWWISRYRDVLDVERDTATYSSAHGSRPLLEFPHSSINKDDPAHSEQRKLVARRFTPGHVRRHEATIRQAVTGLIDEFAGDGSAELVRQLAAPLPAMVIGELIGFGPDRWARVQWWSETTMANAGFLEGDPRRVDEGVALGDFAAEALALYEARQAAPRDDLMSVWAHATVAGAPLPVDEVLNETILLIDGGAETTRSAIGQAVLALSAHPDQHARLVEDPSLLRSTAVEEMIRWSSPILNMRRTVTVDHERHGQRLAAGDQVMLMYPSANRDERVFADPDVFDVARRHNQHVAFGFGTHFCLGANLARLELRVVFEELLRRLPDLRVAPGYESVFAPGTFTRTLVELPVEFSPAG